MRAMLKERQQRLHTMMERQGYDCILAAPSSDLFFLTGVRVGLSERFTCAVFTRQETHFFSPEFELGNLEEETRRSACIHGWNDGDDPFAPAASILRNHRHIGVARHVPSWMLLEFQKRCPECLFSDATGLLGDLRVIKSPEEQEILRDVQHRTGSVFTRILQEGVGGHTERQIADKYVRYCAELGIDSTGPMVASGPNTWLPHHHTGDRVIRDGDVVFLDFGGRDRRTFFRGDTTRTFAVGHIPDGLKEIYDIVREANEAAFRAVRPGVPCRDVDRAARDVIERAGYGSCFTHRLGHGLGLDMHERPFCGGSSDEIVRVGQVFSDEPGIYLPDRFGVRIEDILVVREDGAERLTDLTHELLVVD